MNTYKVKLITSNIETMVSEYTLSSFNVETDNIKEEILKIDWAQIIESKGKRIKNLGTIYEIGEDYALLGYKANKSNYSDEICQFEIDWELIE